METMTAKDQIDSELASRLEDLRALARRLDRAQATNNNDKYEAGLEEVYEYPLGVSRYTTWRIDISTGGPGDWFEIQTDEDGVRRIEYHFAPWFDHASLVLEGDDFETVEQFARHVTADFYIER